MGNLTDPVTIILPVTSNVAFGVAFPIPTTLPVTTKAFVLYLPATTLSSLKTSSIGRPEMSLTLIKLPLRLSTMLKREPEFPMKDILPEG